jgi:hypothetical protein
MQNESSRTFNLCPPPPPRNPELERIERVLRAAYAGRADLALLETLPEQHGVRVAASRIAAAARAGKAPSLRVKLDVTPSGSITAEIIDLDERDRALAAKIRENDEALAAMLARSRSEAEAVEAQVAQLAAERAEAEAARAAKPRIKSAESPGEGIARVIVGALRGKIAPAPVSPN